MDETDGDQADDYDEEAMLIACLITLLLLLRTDGRSITQQTDRQTNIEHHHQLV